MKKTVVSLMIGAIIALTGSAAWGETDVSLIMNGSFENDGEIVSVTTEDVPQYWCDVDIPTGKFLCWVNTDWSTHGYGNGYSLTFYSNTFVDLVASDMAMVSQQVYLEEDVNQIIFDLKLGTIGGDPWDPSKRSAVVLIDGDVIWDSGDWPPDANGEYRNQTVDINEAYKDANWHTLSLAMKSNVSEIEWFYEYIARWDFVKFDAHCGGFGYLWEDLNRNCFVDMFDLEMLAEQWLSDDPNEEYDLFQDGVVNLHDFAFFADSWVCNTFWENWGDDNCFEMELPAGDLNDDGVVNLRDFAISARDWMKEGNCIRSDIDHSGIVDYDDLSGLVDEWLLINWLSRLQ